MSKKYQSKKTITKPIQESSGLTRESLVAPPPTPATKTMNKVTIIALAVITLGLGVLLTWALQSDDVLTVKQTPIPARIIKDSQSTSSVVLLDMDFCKNVSAEGSLRTSFVSNTREIFMPLNRERSPQGCGKWELPVVVPKDLPPDEYKIRLRAVYDVNPLKQGVVEEFESKKVQVTPNDVPNK